MRDWREQQERGWLLRACESDVGMAIAWVLCTGAAVWFGWWYDGYRMARNARILHDNGVGVTAPPEAGK